MKHFFHKFRLFLKLVKFEHSLFALPFAYLGLLLASPGLPSLKTFLLVTAAMVFGRTFGMSINRFADRSFDRRNPRTKEWAEIYGKLSHAFVWGAILISAFLFLSATFFLPKICLILAPVPLFAMVLYPYLKRFTWWSHVFLGGVLAIAPVGAWLAVRGEFALLPILMASSVVCWVAGFDILYSLQDYHFDLEERLHSAPVRLGKRRAIALARLLHGLTLLFFLCIVKLSGAQFIGWAGFTIVSALIIGEHLLLEEYGLAKLDAAFFVSNAWISTLFFLGLLLDRLLRI